MKKRNNKGFTLIELLIVVAIIGIIVAIAIPNLLNAIQRAKQKRTMGDMRTSGTAAEAYAVDFNHYPAAAGYSLPTGLTLGATTFGAPNCAAPCFNGQVVPTYVRVLPLADGWNSFFHYSVGTGTSQDYGIVSVGRDGVAETTPLWGETTNFNNDIIFIDGQFVQYPAGRAELIVLPLRPDPRAPSTGALFFSGPRIAAVQGRGTTGRTALLGGALGLAFASLLLVPCALSGGVPARGDLADFFWPMKAYTAARWASGVPLWNPLSGCGEPWLAQLQTGVFYPGDLPFLLPGAWGPLLGIALHLAIASSGMAAWLSGLGTSRAGALLGAAVFAGGGGFLSLALVYNNFETASFLPWLFLAARHAARGGSPAGLAVAFALAFLGGEPALAAIGAASAALVALATRGDEPGSGPRGVRGASRLAVGLVLGAGLAAAAAIPFFEYAVSSGRLAGVTRERRSRGRSERRTSSTSSFRRPTRSSPARPKAAGDTSRRSRSLRSFSFSRPARARASRRAPASSSRCRASLSSASSSRSGRAAGCFPCFGTRDSRGACGFPRAGSSSRSSPSRAFRAPASTAGCTGGFWAGRRAVRLRTARARRHPPPNASRPLSSSSRQPRRSSAPERPPAV